MSWSDGAKAITQPGFTLTWRKNKERVLLHAVGGLSCDFKFTEAVFDVSLLYSRRRPGNVDSDLHKQTPWPESASELHRPSDHLVSAKLVTTFADKDVAKSALRIPCNRNLGFLDRSPYFFFQVLLSVVLTGLSGPRSRPTTSQKICYRQELWPQMRSHDLRLRKDKGRADQVCISKIRKSDKIETCSSKCCEQMALQSQVHLCLMRPSGLGFSTPTMVDHLSSRMVDSGKINCLWMYISCRRRVPYSLVLMCCFAEDASRPTYM
jgi:hypothetical protein